MAKKGKEKVILPSCPEIGNEGFLRKDGMRQLENENIFGRVGCHLGGYFQFFLAHTRIRMAAETPIVIATHTVSRGSPSHTWKGMSRFSETRKMAFGREVMTIFFFNEK